ncbi:MAG: ABC transporter permease [Lachnospiraceae bacterium]|nr:ABC transporter permease [Lachnospiraceae bacterium]
MKELLSFEFRKLRRTKSLWICTIIMVVLKIAGVVITYATQRMITTLSTVEGISEADLGGTILSSSGLKELATASNGSNITILFAIFVTLFICSDFTEGTIKNILSRGFTREQVFFAKSICIVCAGILFGLLSMLVGFIAGTVAFGVGSGFSSSLIFSMLIQLLALIAYIMMDVLLAVLFTKAGGSMTLGIIIPMVVPMIGQLGDLAFSAIIESIDYNDAVVSRYLISHNLSSISNLNVSGGTLAIAAVIFVVYIILFTLLGILSIRKKEV